MNTFNIMVKRGTPIFHRQLLKQMGGTIIPNPVLSYIVSIGYEFESPSLSPIEFNTNSQIPRWVYSKGHIPMSTPDSEFKSAEILITTDTVPIRETTPLTRLDDYYHQVGDQFLIYARIRDPNPMRFEAPSVLLPNTQYFSNTEFHFTYKYYDPSPLIIKNTLRHAIDSLKWFFTPTQLHLAYYGTDPERTGSVIRLLTMEASELNWLRFIITEPISKIISDLFFYVQMTVGVPLDHIMEVISYLSMGTDDEKYIAYLVGLVGQIGSIRHLHSSQLSGWLFLLLLNMLPTNINEKYEYSYSLRHTLQEIYQGLSTRDREEGQQTLQFLDTQHGSLHVHNQYQHLHGLIQTIVYDNHDPLEKTTTKRYPYQNQIVLVEVRIFPLVLSQLFKTSSKGLTLDQLSILVDQLMSS